MQVIGKDRGNDIVGIAWDDEFFSEDKRHEHVFFDLRTRLDRWRITIEVTNDENEFRNWMGAKSYQFVLLDMLRQEGVGRERSEWVGFDLMKELRENPRGRCVPVVMVTSAADHLRQQGFAFRSNEYLKSKYLKLEWLTTEILEILESQAVRVDRDKIAVFDNTAAGGGAAALADALAAPWAQGFGAAPRFYREFQQYPGASPDVQSAREELRQCLAFVTVRALPSSEADLKANDDFLLRLGLVLSEPRGAQRLIMVNETGHPLSIPLLEEAKCLPIEGLGTDALIPQLIARCNELRWPGCP